MDSDDLICFAEAPGLASEELTEDVYHFLVDFKKKLDIYQEAYGKPVGISVQSRIDAAAWYIKFHSEKSQGVEP